MCFDEWTLIFRLTERVYEKPYLIGSVKWVRTRHHFLRQNRLRATLEGRAKEDPASVISYLILQPSIYPNENFYVIWLIIVE